MNFSSELSLTFSIPTAFNRINVNLYDVTFASISIPIDVPILLKHERVRYLRLNLSSLGRNRLQIKSIILQRNCYQSKLMLIEKTLHSSFLCAEVGRWEKNGITVAGGNGSGSAANQLYYPWSLCVDAEDNLVVADTMNHRIVEWKLGATSGRVLADGHRDGNRSNQLSEPTDVVIDKKKDTIIICDRSNRRVVRWYRQSGTIKGETIIDNIACGGLTINDQSDLYVTNTEKHEVRRYRMGEKRGFVVAGGKGKGVGLNQLNVPGYVCVDKNHTVYVSDWGNHRVMKWNKGDKEGAVVAGGLGEGDNLTQLSHPHGVLVDAVGAVYVADCWNHRVMRWSRGATEGTMVVGADGAGEETNQLNRPIGLTFDRSGNLYVVDSGNHRVQKFSVQLD